MPKQTSNFLHEELLENLTDTSYEVGKRAQTKPEWVNQTEFEILN